MSVAALAAIPTPTWLGYDCRRRFLIGDWLASSPARIRCNASSCNLGEAPGRYDRWAFNEAGLFDTPALASREWADSWNDDGEPWVTYGFALYPMIFSTSGVAACSVEAIVGSLLAAVENPITNGYRFLGYDVVAVQTFGTVLPGGQQVAFSWSCSPLFCNLMAAEIDTNLYTLLGDWEVAVATAERFGREEPEPGPYVIVGVWANALPPVPD